MAGMKKYLLIAGLLSAVALAGCGSSEGDPQQLPPDTSGSTADIYDLYWEGQHADPLSFEGNCFACHATEGDDLLAAQEFTLCSSCHQVDSHANYKIDTTATNSCTQCHDPHIGSKFAQANAAAITEQWSQSGHADYESAAFGDNISAPACLKCHSGKVFAQTIAADPDTAIDPDGGAQVVACIACHDLQARNAAGAFELGALRPVAEVTFPSGAVVSLGASNNLCLECHQGRSSTPTVDARIADNNLDFSNIHYAAAAASLFGTAVQGGYEYAGRTYRGLNTFSSHTFFDVPGLTTCTGCHMGSAADHRFSVDLESCTVCHAGSSFATMAGSPRLNAERIGLLKDQLEGLLIDAGVDFLAGYPYFAGITTPEQLKAAYNWQFASKEKAAFIHNGIYLRQLLYDAIVDMGGTPVAERPVLDQ